MFSSHQDRGKINICSHYLFVIVHNERVVLVDGKLETGASRCLHTIRALSSIFSCSRDVSTRARLLVMEWKQNRREEGKRRRRNIKYHDRTFTRASAHCSDGILKTDERNKEKKCIENLNVRKKEKTKRVRTKLNFLSWAVGNENWFCLICVVAHTSTSTCTLSNLIKTASSSNENEKSSQIEHFSLHASLSSKSSKACWSAN